MAGGGNDHGKEAGNRQDQQRAVAPSLLIAILVVLSLANAVAVAIALSLPLPSTTTMDAPKQQ